VQKNLEQVALATAPPASASFLTPRCLTRQPARLRLPLFLCDFILNV